MPFRRYLTQVSAAAAVASAIALSGCGGIDGIDLNGKVFDMMGISSSAQENQAREPRMAERAPLVVPPNVARLPEPGSGKVSSEDLAAIDDPEQRKLAEAKERERLHAAYCSGETRWKDKAYSPEKTTANLSPYGPCPGLFSSVTGKVNKQ